MDFFLIQLLEGLASASSLFLVAAGLSVIFGVTRIVNFAHGSLFMLGAYLAFSLTQALPHGVPGYWLGVIAATLAVGALGALLEIMVLRRLYRAPELFALLATFGIVLIVADATLAIWGAEELVAPRPPGLGGALPLLGRFFPRYDLVLILVGPAVLGALWLLFNRTRWGAAVRAATENRELVGALGIDARRLFTAVFFLGAALAGLGGALDLPREGANLQMDLSVIVEAFVVVVLGGLGSILGAYFAALIVGIIQAFGIVLFPKLSLALIFLVMAAVLALRPQGLFGRREEALRAEASPPRHLMGLPAWLWPVLVAAVLIVPPLFGGYVRDLVAEIAILALFAASLHFIMGPAGMVSFGHAAFFGTGAYVAALCAERAGLPMLACLVLAPLGAALLGLACGWFCVRLSGIYLAMLTLAIAQILWSGATQWIALTGGDNGMLGVRPDGWAQGGTVFYLFALAIAGGGIYLLRRMIFAPLGYALRAARDAPRRAEASGLDIQALRWAGFTVSAAFAGLAGALFAYAKGSVFPTYLALSRSVDALLIVLLGGVDWVSGPIIGAIAYIGLEAEILRLTDLWRLVLGLAIVALVLVFPQGILGALARRRSRA